MLDEVRHSLCVGSIFLSLFVTLCIHSVKLQNPLLKSQGFNYVVWSSCIPKVEYCAAFCIGIKSLLHILSAEATP